MSLIAELQRRRVIRALVGYAVGSFAVLQIIEPVMHGFRWPDAVLNYVVVALALGFPMVVCVAWVFDVREGRLERTPAHALPVAGGARLALILVGLGLLAAVPGTAWFFLAHRGKRAHAEKAAPARGAAAQAEGALASIAVLPLVNLSSDKEQEYFSDGLSEELLNLLSRVPGLRVAARTSSFAFKGKNGDVRTIAEKLHVTSVLEGSVRKAG